MVAAKRRLSIVVRLLCASIVGPLFVLLISSSPAGAASTPPPTASPLICSSSSAPGVTSSTDNLLPANRWSGAITADHTRYPSGFAALGNVGNRLERQVVGGTAMGIASTEWQVGIATTEMAGRFCLADSVGKSMDSMAATIGNALYGSGIVAVFAVFAVLAGIWKASRGKPRPWQAAAKFLGVAAIFFVSIAGATRTASLPAGQYGTLSPGWIITTVYNAIGNVASVPSNALSSAATAAVNQGSPSKFNDPMSCANYTNQLVTQYKAGYTGSSQSYTVPVALNSMWEASAIPAYTETQFGSNNNFGPLVYCHLLEDNINVLPQNQMGIAKLAAGSFPTATKPSALAWQGSQSNSMADESMIGWAACQTTSSRATPAEWNLNLGTPITNEWTVIQNHPTLNANPYGLTAQECQWFFNVPASTNGAFGNGTNPPSSFASGQGQFNPDMSFFNWTTDSSAITQDAIAANTATGAQPDSVTGTGPTGDGINDYISNLHGTASTGAMDMSIVFLLSSTVVNLIFIVLAAAIIIAKISLLVSMGVFVLVLLAAMLPGGSSNKVTAYGKHLLSLAIFATGASIIISLIAVITTTMSNIAASATGQGSILQMIWIALSPIAAIVIIHHLFKKVLKAPSPFNPNAALAWSGAAGGLAGGMAGGLTSKALFHNNQRRLRNAMRGGGRRGRGDRQDRMDPAGTPETSNAGGPGGRKRGGQNGPKGNQNGPQDGPKGSQNGPKGGQGQSGSGGSGEAPVVVPPEPGSLSPAQTARAQRREAQAEYKAAKEMKRKDLAGRAEAQGRTVSKQRALERLDLARERFRANPVRSSLKVAKYAAVGLAGAAVAPIGAAVGLAAVAGVYGAKRAKRRYGPSGLTAHHRSTLDAYRADQERRNQQSEEKESSSDPNPASRSRPVPNSPSGRDPNEPLGPEPEPQPSDEETEYRHGYHPEQPVEGSRHSPNRPADRDPHEPPRREPG